MKKIFGLVFGGLQQKICNLCIITILLMVGLYIAVAVFQSNVLNELVTQTNEQQKQAIVSVSEQTMTGVVNSTLVKDVAMETYIANDLFADVISDVTATGELVQKLYENPDSFGERTLSYPDKRNDGKTSVQVVFEEGKDFDTPGIRESMEKLGNIADVLETLYDGSERLGSLFVGSPDGYFIIADDRSASKFDENGELKDFPVRERPWYKGAAEKGSLYFTGIEFDAFTNYIGIVCAYPVIVDGKLKAVVGADIFLESMAEAVGSSEENGSFMCVLNEKGQVVFSPKKTGELRPEQSVEAPDMRESENAGLAEFIKNAMTSQTGVCDVAIDGEEYYIAGAPMSATGWAFISGVQKERTMKPTETMIGRYNEIINDADITLQENVNRSLSTTVVLTAAILILAVAGSLFVANRIVKPLGAMTKRIADLSGHDLQFRMSDEYGTGDEIQVLAESFAGLSERTVKYIENIKDITAEKERIGTELSLATDIQSGMLPSIFPAFPERKEFDIHASMDPAKEVGGDFYDFFLIDSNHLAMVIADVSGKGVPAALFMMASKILINDSAMLLRSPGAVLEYVNNQICGSNTAEMFVTVWLGVLDIETGILTCSNAGHENPALKHGGKFEMYEDEHGFVVGGIGGMKYSEYRIKLDKGDCLFVYTDGVSEATDAGEEQFGNDRLLAALNKDPDAAPKELLQNVRAAIDEFTGDAQQFDDITMIGFTYLGPEENL